MNIARNTNILLIYLGYYLFKDKKAQDVKTLYKICNKTIEFPLIRYNYSIIIHCIKFKIKLNISFF